MRVPSIKSPEELNIMREGGAKLRRVKEAIAAATKVGVSAWDLEEVARDTIKKEGAESSFMKVPGYSWATCINLNDGIVHGIPTKAVVFKEGDLVSIDVGVFFMGFHTDTSTSVLLTESGTDAFFEAGKAALAAGISKAKAGKKIGDISSAIEKTLHEHNVAPVTALVGHGIGRELHEPPYIPCFVSGSADEMVEIVPGMALAVEVMYTAGSPDLVRDADGWTIRTKDGKISGLFEDTLVIEKSGSTVIT